jgi:hypothetical protein
MSLDHDDEPPRAASVWALLQRDEPDPRAIQSAYLRFTARDRAHVSAFTLLRWLVAGFVLGWGVAFAATGDPLFGAGLRRTAQAPPPVATVVPRPTSTARARQHAPVEPSALPPLDSAAPPLDSAAPPLESAAQERKGSTPPPAASLPAPVLAELQAADPKWQRAAAALKLHDYATAETALREIERAGTPGDRDAASLALAQVLLTRGRGVEARARLERLSVHASVPLVREKARALLAEIFSSPERSSTAPPVPQ